MRRRWNGWGDPAVCPTLGDGARGFLEDAVGPGCPGPDADFGATVDEVSPPEGPSHPLVDRDPAVRLVHARGQSLPDWIALRSGRPGRVPDGVAFPATSDDVRTLLAHGARHGVTIIPYGGGTSVVGGVNPAPHDPRPAVTVSLERLTALVDLDPVSHSATFEAGVPGPVLEAALAARGYTLGHFPQSFEYSTLGGWVCTRSSGQESLGYGRIEDLFVGGVLETGAGTVELPHVPASAAGPDLKALVLGSEGRCGILTQATVRMRREPESQTVRGAFVPDFAAGVAALQALARRRLSLTMVRLSTAAETRASLSLAGHERLVKGLETYLRWRGAGRGKCLILYGLAGTAKEVAFGTGQVARELRRHGGVGVGTPLGQRWHDSRFTLPYLRNTLWDEGYAVDTFETSVPWARVEGLVADLHRGVEEGLAEEGERVHVQTHLSHLYTDGCSVYTTYLYRRAGDPTETLDRWRRLKGVASDTVVSWGGTISHQHGVGVDHRPYLTAEKGPLGIEVLAGVARTLDPAGILNPGKLLPDPLGGDRPCP